MGYTIEITCNECSFRKLYNLGRSLQKEALSSVLNRQDSSVKAAVEQMHNAYRISDFEYGRQLMLCKRCHAIYDEELLIVAFEDAKDYMTSKHCLREACKSHLVILELETIEHTRCPHCLKYALKYRRICDWK